MALSEERRALLERLVRGAARPAGPGRLVFSSPAQRRLWCLEQLPHEQVPYTLHAVRSLRFSVDAEVLRRALDEINRRHEVLRTTFRLHDDEVMQEIAAERRQVLD